MLLQCSASKGIDYNYLIIIGNNTDFLFFQSQIQLVVEKKENYSFHNSV